MSPRGQVVEGFTILPTLESLSLKRIVCLCLSLSLSVCLDAFAQFLSYEVQTSQDRQRLPGTGRGGVYDSTYLRVYIYKEDCLSRSVSVFLCLSRCIRTVFKLRSFKLHRIVNDSPGQAVDGFTILPHPRGVRNKGLVTQKT